VSGSGLVLAVGDVHLGTRCSGLADIAGAASGLVDLAELSPAGALRRAVDLALARRVDAVLFAGDVVESANARFEAMLPLEESVRRLLDAGIEVIAVAGNHDVEALPRLARLIDGFALLGEGGRWEAATLARGGKPFAEVVGWSFPERAVRRSPMAQLLEEPLPRPQPELPRIGLLHADLGASGGSYAPIRQAELDDSGYDAWLLGHIHKPSIGQAAQAARAKTGVGVRPSGYLGSLVGLDPSEVGPRGPWLVRVFAEGRLELEHVPLAPPRWDSLDVSVQGLADADDVPDRMLHEAQQHARALAAAGAAPLALGLRVRLVGTSEFGDAIRDWIKAGDWKSLGRQVDDSFVFFNRILDELAPPQPLETIACGNDPAALLAQSLLSLQRRDSECAELLAAARERLAATAREEFWRAADEHRHATDPLADDALRDMLLESGRAALARMLANRDSREPS